MRDLFSLQIENGVFQNDLYYRDTLLLSYQINYPKFSSGQFPATANRLSRYYCTKACDVKCRAVTTLWQAAVEQYQDSVANGYPIMAYDCQVDYTVTLNQNCILSLYTDQYEFTGGAHGNTIRTAETWNVQTGQCLTLEQLFPCQRNPRDLVIQQVVEQIRQQENSPDFPYFDDYETLVKQSFCAKDFYLTEEGLVVFFQQYEIAPYASGIPSFTIPYNADTGPVKPCCK